MFFVFSICSATPIATFGAITLSLVAARMLYQITEKKRAYLRAAILKW
jgi:hypothetical protein